MIISVIRTVILYIFIIIAMRVMGKRQIGELQTSELVITLLISDIAALPMQDMGEPLLSGIVPIFILISCEVLLSVGMLKKSKFRKLICGKPIIIISDGKILQEEMHRLRMSTEDLSEQLRQQNIFNIDTVAYAIVETNGKLSVLKKTDYQDVTAKMLNLYQEDDGLEVVVISDGEICDYSLKINNLSLEWLYNTLNENNIKVEDIFIMTADKNKNVNIIKKYNYNGEKQ